MDVDWWCCVVVVVCDCVVVYVMLFICLWVVLGGLFVL